MSRPWTGALLVVALAASCGGEPESEADQPQTIAVVPATVEQGATTEPGLRPFLPDAMQRSTRPESFPHEAHGQVTCAVCHEVPRGHASHTDLGCADCHTAAASATVQALSPEQCQSCHHDAAQLLACESCHESRPTLASVQELALEVWAGPRERALDFDHSIHDDLDCSSCHQALPALTPAVACASCHAEHHTVESSCAACHVEPAAGAHGVEVHLTCSGSGCHRAPEVEAIATTRPVCESCHLDQIDHEPGGSCIECHRMRGGTTALAGWRHP